MSKETLINEIIINSDMTKKQAEEALKAVTTAIKGCLEKGEEVSLLGFGKFEVKQYAERKGRNPNSGEEITIPAKKGVRFKPGKALKEAVA
ncbi:HU family DNA-binding protein [Galenea microaerophila]